MSRVEPKFADALSLAEYAARYQDDVEAKVKRDMLPSLRNGGRSIRVKEAWEIAAYNTEWTAKNNRKLVARGWIGYSPDDFDRAILREREKRGAVELEAITKLDRDFVAQRQQVANSITPKERKTMATATLVAPTMTEGAFPMNQTQRLTQQELTELVDKVQALRIGTKDHGRLYQSPHRFAVGKPLHRRLRAFQQGTATQRPRNTEASQN